MPDFCPIDHDAFVDDIRDLATKIRADTQWRPNVLIGLGRGGLVPGAYLSHAIGMGLLSIDYSSQDFAFVDELIHKLAYRTRQGEKLLLVDDINDSGRTIGQIREAVTRFGGVSANVRVAVLLNNIRSSATADYWSREIDRATDKRWFVFPWEAMAPQDVTARDAEAVPERLA